MDNLHSGEKFRVALLCSVAAMVVLACGLQPAKAEQDDAAKKLPSNAAELYSPIDKAFSQPQALPGGPDLRVPETLLGFPETVEEPAVLQDLKARLRNEDPFLRDTKLNLYFRTGYLDRKNPDATQSQAWAAGSDLWYQSGYLRDWLQIGAAVFTSQPIFAPDGEGGTFLLAKDQDQMTTLGLAYGRIRFLNHELVIGRQHIKTPYANPHDSRMIPVAFEGAVLIPRQDMVETFNYITGYLWRYKPRDSSVFESFSEGLGVEEDRGMLVNGVKFIPVQGLTIGAIDYWIADTLNTAYAEVDWLLPSSTHDLKYRFGINYTDQRSVGKQLIEGAPYSTFQVSARFAVSYGSLTFRTAVSANGDDAAIRSPFGSFPAFTTLDEANFERAGEKAMDFGVVYDFSEVITEGLKIQIRYGQGRDAVDPATGASLPDRNEWNLNLDYRPKSGPLENVRFHLDYARLVLQDDTIPRRTVPRLVAIFTYLVPLL